MTKSMHVAKLLLIDADNRYLMMYRSNHPVFGDDPDLPGGTAEPGESLEEALVREVFEEINVSINVSELEQICVSDTYSNIGTLYALYALHASARPVITISWEHKSYEWLERDEFIQICQEAKDNFMHMTADAVQITSSAHNAAL